MKIFNLTQHAPTPEMIQAGVINLPDNDWQEVKSLQTFEELPTRIDLYKAAMQIKDIAVRNGCKAVLIGGAPFFMRLLEQFLHSYNIKTFYAFSKRESVEQIDSETGTVRKVSIFRFAGFIEGV
jgi:hypothetical protein